MAILLPRKMHGHIDKVTKNQAYTEGNYFLFSYYTRIIEHQDWMVPWRSSTTLAFLTDDYSDYASAVSMGIAGYLFFTS